MWVWSSVSMWVWSSVSMWAWSSVSMWVWSSVSPMFLLADHFCLRKITTDPHILADVNLVCLDDRYPKLNIYVADPILDS
jgi:hypothetical protein